MRIPNILLAGVSLLALAVLSQPHALAADEVYYEPVQADGAYADDASRTEWVAQEEYVEEQAPDGTQATGIFQWLLRGQEKRSDLALSAKLQRSDQWRLRNIQPPISSGSLLQQRDETVYLQGDYYAGEPAVTTTSELRGYLVDSLENSNKLKAELHRANAAQAATEAAFGAFLPKVTFQAEKGEELSRDPLVATAGRYTTGIITGEWTIFSSGLNLANFRAARFQAQSADLKYLATERQALYDSLIVYLQLYSAQKLVASIEDTIWRLEDIRASTGRLYAAGFASRTDIAQVEAEIASVRAQYEQAISGLREQEIAYKTATGREPPPATRLPDVFGFMPPSLEAALDRAVIGNFSIGATHLAASAADQRSHAAMARYMPKISLYGETETDLHDSRSGPFMDKNVQWDVGVRLTVPLADFTAAGTYREARENAIAARYDAMDTEREVKKSIETAWSNYESSKGRTAALRKRAAAQTKVVTGLRKQVEAGLKTVNDLLREEIELTRADIEIIQNKVNETAAAYSIAVQYPDISLNELAPI